MPSLSPDVRASVRALYEALPYPPPETDLDGYRDNRRTIDASPAHFAPLFWPHRPPPGDLEILVAGCGTSQAAKIAIQSPRAQVTAIDVSTASLRHTESLRTRYGLENLRLEERPIEAAGGLGKRFDLVVSTGVLHHLENPAAGLRALRGVLAPDGAMLLMVYATYGRFGVYLMQEYCARLGIRPEPAEIRDLMATVAGLAPEHPIRAFTRVADDLAHPAGVADALLHPRDRAFTVPQVYAWLEAAGLALDRWFLQAPYLPRCATAGAGPHAARLAALPVREQHAAMELFRGTMTMHTMVVAHGNRAPTGWDDLAAAGWRDLVPIPFPGAAATDEPPPAGAVTVLRQRGHRDRDLMVTLDERESRVYRAIDGSRTAGDLAATADVDPERVARPLLERLWLHDLVLIRATGGANQM